LPADQERHRAGRAGDAGPARHRHRCQAVHGDRGHDHQERDREDLRRAADVNETSWAENVDAVAAATMPRGAIDPVD
jgi:hypothetical protein